MWTLFQVGTTKDRPWSRYSIGSSAHEKKNQKDKSENNGALKNNKKISGEDSSAKVEEGMSYSIIAFGSQ